MTIKNHYDLRAVKAYALPKDFPKFTGYSIQSKELIGVEVEVENVRRVDILRDAWQSKADNSLRNNGIEFVTRPIAACDFPAAINSLVTESLGADACFSPRTSVHVHLNYSDNELEDVYNTVLLYSVFERLWFRFVGRQRIKNIFCVPLTETDHLREAARRGIRTDSWQKYTGLNLKPLAELGTIEFRHMHGTADVHKLCVWVDLITRLKEFCVNQGSGKIRPIIASMDDDFQFERLLSDIFGDAAHHLKYKSVDDVAYTYRAAKVMLTQCADTLNRIARDVVGEAPYFQVKVQ